MTYCRTSSWFPEAETKAEKYKPPKLRIDQQMACIIYCAGAAVPVPASHQQHVSQCQVVDCGGGPGSQCAVIIAASAVA
jgi:hypothetical protein